LSWIELDRVGCCWTVQLPHTGNEPRTSLTQ
jgi:hypothetical protein